MSNRRYMIFRKMSAVWVPLTMWNECQEWDSLADASLTGFTRDQALKVINSNRNFLPEGARYCLMPMAQFLSDELP